VRRVNLQQTVQANCDTGAAEHGECEDNPGLLLACTALVAITHPQHGSAFIPAGTWVL
jgi:hypothetical protein